MDIYNYKSIRVPRKNEIEEKNKLWYRTSVGFSGLMIFIELFAGLTFHSHAFIMDGLFRIQEIQSSNNAFHYFE
jgi:hypothetical protein